MSADNWAVCPRCLQRADDAWQQKVKDLFGSYGKIPAEEFITARENTDDAHPVPEDYQTFREEWSIYGAHTGLVEVSYSGRCTACSLNLDFKHYETIPGLD